MRITRLVAIALALFSTAALAAPAGVFFGAHFEPPAGRVLSGWGQFSSAWDQGQPAGKGDGADLEAYEKAVAPHPPALISFYVTLDSPSVSGFLTHYRAFAATQGFFVAQIAINFRGMEHDAAIGLRDPQLLVLADGLQEVGRPVLLRIGYDFNQAGAPYESSGYIGAFRHACGILQQDHLNFATVWDATPDGFADPNHMKWFPGDDVVDWWGINLFDPRDFSRSETQAFLDDAARHHKPVLIAEAAPLFQNPNGRSLRGAKSESEALKWYVTFFDFVRANAAVKAFSLTATDQLRIDTRIARWPKVAAYVKQQLADPRLIDATEASSILRPHNTER